MRVQDDRGIRGACGGCAVRLATALAARQVAHRGDRASSRYRNPEANLVGLWGELAFARRFGLVVDMREAGFTDGGVDFRLGARAVDVKTVDVRRWKQEPQLLRNADKPPEKDADVFVLATTDGQRTQLLGWATKEELRAAPVKETPFGPAHYVDAHALRKLESLLDHRNTRPADSGGRVAGGAAAAAVAAPVAPPPFTVTDEMLREIGHALFGIQYDGRGVAVEDRQW